MMGLLMRSKAEFIRLWMQSSSSGPAKSWRQEPEGKEFSGSPTFYIFVDMDYFALLSRVSWIPTAYQSEEVIVPKGFITDFASVPRLFWSMLPPIGRYGYAALFHDWVYWDQKLDRRQADRIFKETMEELSVSFYVVFVMYWAVRLFGWAAWRGHKKAKQAGEKRILKRFPSDIKTSWAIWKAEPDVFE
jgi:Protein of unknown function (DUF1353)